MAKTSELEAAYQATTYRVFLPGGSCDLRVGHACDALADYLAWRTPQIEALKLAVAAADRGDFASADEVEQFFKAYET